METISLSIIIPAYNEEKRIGVTLRKIKAYIDRHPRTVEVIVVINNTTDNTKTVAEEMRRDMHYLRYIDLGMINSKSGSKGYAIAEGIKDAKGEHVLYMDADSATEISELDRFWHYFTEGYEVVFGSRYIKGAEIKRAWFRNIMGRLSNFVVQLLLHPGIYDTQCGFKAFTTKAAKSIFQKVTLKGWGFDLEVLEIAKKQGFRIKEVPVCWQEVGASSVKAKAFASSFEDLLHVRKKSKKGEYH